LAKFRAVTAGWPAARIQIALCRSGFAAETAFSWGPVRRERPSGPPAAPVPV